MYTIVRNTAALALLVFVLAGCGGTQEITTSPPTSATFSFSEDIQPVIAEEFAPLLTEDEGLQFDSWEALMAGSRRGQVIIPFDPEGSVLLGLAQQAADEGASGAPSQQEIDLVRRWIEQGARNDAGDVAYEDARELLYVPNEASATVSIIDMANNVVIRTVDLTDLGFSANAKPHDTAVEPDGSHWYVSLITENTVLKFNRDNEIVGRASFEVPGMLALDPGSDNLYVGRSMSAVNPPHSVGIINRSEMTTEVVDVFYPRPHAIAATPDGAMLYSASLAENQIAAINTRSLEVELTSLEGPTHTLVQLTSSPDGGVMVGGGQVSGEFFFFDISGPMPEVEASLTLGGQPWHPLYTPNGSAIYVPRKTADAITVLNADERQVATVIEGNGVAKPHGAEVRADGRYVYVSNLNTEGSYDPRYNLSDNSEVGTVVVIDTQTNEIAKIIEVGTNPKGLGAS